MYLDKVKKQLIELQIVSPDQLLGCTLDEIIGLEQRLEISLPVAYKEFLLLMGHSASKFLQGSDCFFKHLPYLREWACEILQENKFSKTLPEDAFVFFMHQGYQFSFFIISEGDNPPTYSYCEGTKQTSFMKSHEKFSDFLETEVKIQAQYLYSSVTS